VVWTLGGPACNCFAGYKVKQPEGFPIVNMLLKQKQIYNIKKENNARQSNVKFIYLQVRTT